MTERGAGNPLLSIIVCTRNRAARLRRALESLVAQTIPASDWELVVVDNGSTDDTPGVVREFASRGPVWYTCELRQGLNRARNRGISLACGQLLAFTDDDVIVHRDWASRIIARFDADPNVAAVFGYTYADPQVPSLFSLRTRPNACYLVGKEHVWESSGGNNMAYRRAVIAQIGLFDPLLDVGSKYPGAGDGEFQYRFLKAGFRAFYDPEIKVKHEPDIANRPLADEFYRADAGIAAWYCKHLLRGDLYAGRMFLVHIRRIVGMRSLMASFCRLDTRALMFRRRRLTVLLRAFFSRALDDLRGRMRTEGSAFLDFMARAVARSCEASESTMQMLRTRQFKGKYRVVMQAKPVEVVADLGGIRYRLDLTDTIQRLAYFGLYRDQDVERVLGLIPCGGICIDVGANVGFYALNFARTVGPHGAVYAFEPDPRTCGRLNDNVRLNGFQDVVRTYQTAVTNRNGFAALYLSDSSHTAWHSLVEFKDIAVGTIQVPTVTLDDFLRRRDIDRVDLLKVDVEASEFELLEGTRCSLRNQVFRYILIEFNGVRLAERGKTCADFLRVLADGGYRPVSLNLELLERMREDVAFARGQCLNLLFEPGI